MRVLTTTQRLVPTGSAEVRALLADASTHPRWDRGLVSMTVTPAGVRQSRRLLGRTVDLAGTLATQDSGVGLALAGAGLELSFDYQIEPVQGRVRVRLDISLRLESAPPIAPLTLERQLQRDASESLAAIAYLLG